MPLGVLQAKMLNKVQARRAQVLKPATQKAAENQQAVEMVEQMGVLKKTIEKENAAMKDESVVSTSTRASTGTRNVVTDNAAVAQSQRIDLVGTLKTIGMWVAIAAAAIIGVKLLIKLIWRSRR